MVQSDAWLKSVWHGVFMSRERRSKFADRWRQLAEPSLTRSISNEYESSGLQELKQDGDYADAKKNFVSEAKSEEQTRSDDEFFSSFVDDLSMVLTVYLDKISQWKNSFMFNGNYLIQSQIKSVEEKFDSNNVEKKEKCSIEFFVFRSSQTRQSTISTFKSVGSSSRKLCSRKFSVEKRSSTIDLSSRIKLFSFHRSRRFKTSDEESSEHVATFVGRRR